ncbi:glycosyltransferase family 2 protein [Pseudomonas soli]|uniref:glycosyltransferase family 2 protein n=1 Tax=Pseudomonas soli TaxID=1306993 RepID=UPI000F4FBD2A
MPTYARAASGYFERAVRSVQQQQLQNFELIIIDDGSVDGTEAIIQRLMSEDSRIATIRYRSRIGLPAISVNLGFEYSRGQRILFSFDDNVLTSDGLIKLNTHLLQHEDVRICYGQTRMKTETGWVLLGDGDFDNHTARYSNSVGNGAILFDRSVFEEVGLYDPHVIIARLCDWDLWRRMRHIGFHRVDAVISEEHGVVLADSLGNTVAYDYVGAFEWAEIARNDRLKPSVWRQYEVLQPPAFLSFPRVQKLARLIEKSYSHLGEQVVVQQRNSEQGYLLVLGDVPISGELVFAVKREQIVDSLDYRVFLNFSKEFLSGCRAVILSRYIDKNIVNLACLLRKAGVPYYYYLDDVLVSKDYPKLFTHPAQVESARYYQSEEARQLIRQADGVLATSGKLVEKMREYNQNVLRLNCTPPPCLLAGHEESVEHFCLGENENIRIGFFSTVSKLGAFMRYRSVFERLHKRTGRRIELYVPCFAAQFAQVQEYFVDAPYIELNVVGRESSYVDFILKARAQNLHYILHPYNEEEVSGTEFYLYKTYNILISAYLCNVVPIIPIRPPFEELKALRPVLGELITTTDAEVFDILLSGLQTPGFARRYIREMGAYIETFYPNATNLQVLDELLARHSAQYDNVETMDLTSLVVPPLSFPSSPATPRRHRAQPAAHYVAPGAPFEPWILIHCPDLDFFSRHQLVFESLQHRRVICLMPAATQDVLLRMGEQYRGTGLLWCSEIERVVELLPSIGLLISPFVMPIPAHASMLELLVAAHDLGIPVLGLQFELFQGGWRSAVHNGHGVLSQAAGGARSAFIPVCDRMLDWFDGENGIGYTRNVNLTKAVTRQDYVLITSDLDAPIYSSDESMAFVMAVVKLVKHHPECRFVWSLRPEERAAGHLASARGLIESAAAEFGNLDLSESKLPLQSVLARARLLIAMPSTLLLDAEAGACPTLIYRCAGNASLVDACGHEGVFADYPPLRRMLGEVFGAPDELLYVLSSGLYKPFSEIRLKQLVDQCIRSEPASVFESARCAMRLVRPDVRPAPASSSSGVETTQLQVIMQALVTQQAALLHTQQSGEGASLSSSFDSLVHYTAAFFKGARGHRTRMSLDLGAVNYFEVTMPEAVESLREISLALRPMLPSSRGVLGVEIVSSEQAIVGQSTVPLNSVQVGAPTNLTLPVALTQLKANWLLRVFVRDAEAPVFIYEIERKSLFRRRRTYVPLLSLQ